MELLFLQKGSQCCTGPVFTSFHPHTCVVDEKIQPKPSARNLRVIIDQCLDLNDHVNKICVSCQYHLRNIAKIRKYLSEDTSQILVHAFISSKLDNCNSLLYGLPKHLLNRLRLIQNTAARIVTLSKRFDHITPILFKLHWLPLNYRIHFKILLLVYKCLNSLAPTYLSATLMVHDYNKARFRDKKASERMKISFTAEWTLN